jgi:UDP-N-acetylglucosamine 2-epimerase (non-hydrolysing)
MKKGPIFLVLGIRPDVIRASIIIRELRKGLGDQFKLVWSGQHYSDNLKDIFFRELQIASPDIELYIQGNSDAELVSSMIMKLSDVIVKEKPVAVVFLGDTNTVTGSIAAAQLNIPVIHIEGCMRSYDWRMPEEKYRTIADHLSDLIYCYLEDYKYQGIAEGIPESNIVVTGNPIVDVIQEYFLTGKLKMNNSQISDLLLEKYKLKNRDFFVMTAHRRENVENHIALKNILNLAEAATHPVIFPASYRTQKMISAFELTLPNNVIQVDPIGYLELLEIMYISKGVLTDSGTIVEEAAILGVPSIQMRTSTERFQVYTCGASIKFDPFNPPSENLTIDKLLNLQNTKWQHPFGDGRASYRIVEDLLRRFNNDDFSGHHKSKFEPFSSNSYSSESNN